jgi:hypothetical protein
VQPRFASRRPLRRETRLDRPRRQERLSDPVLVTRAKAGDQLELAALCERRAARLERQSA